ncbi:MAG TPA: endonuclease [Bacteroidales bacterium]|jgi:hypothetical protein|nr:endonuclease [Bacteroidales bacterium]
MPRHKSLFLSILLIAPILAWGQTDKQSILISFYNVENLFDTINNEGVRDTEYTPEGRREWNSQRYYQKLDNLAKVIGEIGSDDDFKNGPDILGVCEVENEQVLNDLIRHENLKKKKYRIVHYNSPDKRGIDVALVYKPKKFKLESSKPYPLYIFDPISGKRIYTRDQLLVSGTVKKQKIHLIVNHWPSRWGGELRSQPLRLAAAQLTRHITDSLLAADSLASVIVMGDLNDDPDNLSIKAYLNTSAHADSILPNQLLNTSAELFQSGMGTLKYQGKWNLFDQIIITPALLQVENGYQFQKFAIVNKDYLFQQEGKYAGYPLRTFGGKTYLNGYSDHLPVYLILKKD